MWATWAARAKTNILRWHYHWSSLLSLGWQSQATFCTQRLGRPLLFLCWFPCKKNTKIDKFAPRMSSCSWILAGCWSLSCSYMLPWRKACTSYLFPCSGYMPLPKVWLYFVVGRLSAHNTPLDPREIKGNPQPAGGLTWFWVFPRSMGHFVDTLGSTNGFCWEAAELICWEQPWSQGGLDGSSGEPNIGKENQKERDRKRERDIYIYMCGARKRERERERHTHTNAGFGKEQLSKDKHRGEMFFSNDFEGNLKVQKLTPSQRQFCTHDQVFFEL